MTNMFMPSKGMRKIYVIRTRNNQKKYLQLVNLSSRSLKKQISSRKKGEIIEK